MNETKRQYLFRFSTVIPAGLLPVSEADLADFPRQGFRRDSAMPIMPLPIAIA